MFPTAHNLKKKSSLIIMIFAFADHSKSVRVRTFKVLLFFYFFKPHLDEV